MWYYIIFPFIITITVLLLANLFYIKYVNSKKFKDQYLAKHKQELNEDLERQKIEYSKALEIEQQKGEKEKQKLFALLRERQEIADSYEQLAKEKQQEYEDRVKSEEKLINQQIEQYKKHQEEITDIQLKEYIAAKQKESDMMIENYRIAATTQTEQIDSSIAELKQKLDDYYQKVNVINNEIMRRREIEEKEDFFKIILPTEAIDDITLLNQIRQKLHSPAMLNKLIYDNYVSKPVNEMIKRVLKGEAPSGIYCITRLKTGERYIGKSTNIKNRWQQHVKTVYGVGTIAHSILHTTMERDGVENFTFEVIEEVPSEKLTEREKYWTEFYDTKKYGLNERVG